MRPSTSTTQTWASTLSSLGPTGAATSQRLRAQRPAPRARTPDHLAVQSENIRCVNIPLVIHRRQDTPRKAAAVGGHTLREPAPAARLTVSVCGPASPQRRCTAIEPAIGGGKAASFLRCGLLLGAAAIPRLLRLGLLLRFGHCRRVRLLDDVNHALGLFPVRTGPLPGLASALHRLPVPARLGHPDALLRRLARRLGTLCARRCPAAPLFPHLWQEWVDIAFCNLLFACRAMGCCQSCLGKSEVADPLGDVADRRSRGERLGGACGCGCGPSVLWQGFRRAALYLTHFQCCSRRTTRPRPRERGSAATAGPARCRAPRWGDHADQVQRAASAQPAAKPRQ